MSPFVVNMHFRAVCLLSTLAFVALLAAPAQAQIPPGLPIPPETFAATHTLGSFGVVNARHLALGGAYVADARDGWHGNPAGMVSVKEPTFLGLYTAAPFDQFVDLQVGFAGVAVPLDRRWVGKLSFTGVGGEGLIGGAPVPLRLDTHETGIGVDLAYRASKRLAWGFGTVLPRTNSVYTIEPLGAVTHLRSRPSRPGGRIGVIYTPHPKWSVGATYDNFMEKVTQRAPAFHLPAASFQFHTTGARIGTAFRPDDRTTVLVDYEAFQVVGNGTETKRRRTLAGIERRVGSAALRVGLFDGRLTGGVGVDFKAFNLSYGFTRRYGSDLPDQGAGVAHSVQAIVRF